MTTPPPPEIGRLQSKFLDKTFSAHPSAWDSLWRESYTPWDRGGPSLALQDLLLEQHELFFPQSSSNANDNNNKKKKTALVPGCGRGYDVLLLAAFGYDVTGLDCSATGIQEARENQQKVSGEEAYAPKFDGVSKGSVKWLEGNFFRDDFLGETATSPGGKFDLIYDYTFLVALPADQRPKWAKRMSELLQPGTGRLVCLEWPLHKPASTGGPPWGTSAEAYAAHLNHPGEEIAYDESGAVVQPLPSSSSSAASALKQLVRLKPKRTHKAGYDEEGNVIDFISVWALQ
ncbi:S-adenosyl-L-methionine-dependent methyltransferase [Podospora didyma]|uniref:S-adenosyl-L-methionine-dependent methyltransferase n=1 Tax=Podospora didyma TaxID=330526 RepID=A0AAE0K5Z1_9PEZI|nr:S-adenosyl-L-methionine-dependent methyltransferase [Podospora didyma]